MKLSFIYTLLFSAIAFSATATQRANYASPSDPGVINQERILYWLEKRGELAPNADPATRKLALESYLNKKSFEKKVLPGILGKQVQKAEHFIAKQRLSTLMVKDKSRTTALSATTASKDVETTVKVLAIMIDFPDLKYNANRLTANDTSMYYSDYSQQHYNDLLFSPSGYAGPSEQNIISAYQYYQQESGGTFFFTGQAHGWVTADNEARYYGENDADNNFDDKNVPALVLEAVTKAVSEFKVDLSEYDQVDTYDFDNDGVLNEPDGIIDHVMIFHSSIGEEAGGGVLAEDAIWSHRYFVYSDNTNEKGVVIPGTSIRIFGYTINPIDAATGVTVHEFGHDLGLEDEYDTDNGALGSPVGDWSVMAAGSWLGNPGGTSPATFSPLARDYLSGRYQGNWINQLEVDFSALTSESINLVAANNHQTGINQVKVNLPPHQIAFDAPIHGEFQYYSGKENLKNNSLSFNISLPSEAATLTMTARWNIETDWDYLQVLVNGTAIAGNQTKVTNNFYHTVTHFISGNSANLNEAYGALSWVDLGFDLAKYANQNVTIELRYVTDANTLEYGFVADQISVKTRSSELFFSGGENANEVQLQGFKRIGDQYEGKSHHYYIQLRDYTGTDEKLADSGYEPGVLLWYSDQNINDNQVNNHPGKVFIGVVDADQHLIKSGQSTSGTSTQIRDATFSLFDQSPNSDDTYLTNNVLFSDCEDYSSPKQPQSGILLPSMGLEMKVIEQDVDSHNAKIELSAPHITNESSGLLVNFSVNDCSMLKASQVNWAISDGTVLEGDTIEHTFQSAGEYDVSVSYQIPSGTKTLTRSIIVGNAITGDIVVTNTGQGMSFNSTLTGGYGDFSYQWDFGDGQQSTSKNPTHLYQVSGSYRVTLNVSDGTVQIYTFSTNVDAIIPLNVSISTTRNNFTVSFQSTVTGGYDNYSYQWDFGDGNTANSASTSHTYSQAGNYTATLIVTDDKGDIIKTSTNVSVSAPVVTQPKAASSSGGGVGIFALVSLLLLRLSTRTKVRS